jgi:hypothetical protein
MALEPPPLPALLSTALAGMPPVRLVSRQRQLPMVDGDII